MSKTFRSYYHAFTQNDSTKHSGELTDINETPENTPELSHPPECYPGEKVIAHAQGVHVFQPLSSKNQGLIGHIFITNFRLSFQTIRFPDDRLQHYSSVKNFWHPWTPGLIDIPLSSISGLYRISKSGKRKAFKVGPLKRILILCRNFRMETFSFQQSPTNDSHGVASALMGYVEPSEKNRLFVYSYGGKSFDKIKARADLKFSTRSDWYEELFRAIGDNHRNWRIMQGNEHFHVCSSLPKCFVVPTTIGDDHKLEQICGQLGATDEHRPLIWTWSLMNGSSLCRASYGDIEDEFLNAVKEAHPLKQSPRVIDVGILCPSVREIRKHFECWRDAFLVESAVLLESSDDKWFGEVENSKWFASIFRCLETTRLVVETMLQRVSVILKESGDRDVNCIVSSLAQICLEPWRRTVNGFQQLIEKEFVAFGHRFQDRLGLVRQEPDVESPVFLLFLECVYQLSVEHPEAFEFGDGFLILIWDSALMGTFSTFSFNCHRDISPTVPSILPSVWSIDLLASGRFYNPLYSSSFLLRKIQAAFPFFKMDPLPSDVIIPTLTLPFLKLWKNLYFRFIPPLSSVSAPKMDAIKRFRFEIEYMWKDIDKLSSQNGHSGHLGSVGHDYPEDATDGEDEKDRNVIRRRSQLVRPFNPNIASQSLMTFQK